MAAFHINQRVRVVRVEPDSGPVSKSTLGKCGFINRIGSTSATGKPMEYGVELDGMGDGFCFNSCHLAPLLPPDDAADQFLASLKKLGSEPVNDAPKVTVREGK